MATWGNTAVGTYEGACANNRAVASLFTSPRNITAPVSITMCIAFTTSGNFKGVIWDGTTGSVITNGVGDIVTVSDSTKAWYTSNFSTPPTLTPNKTYILGAVFDAYGTIYDSGLLGNAKSLWIQDGNSYSSPTTLTLPGTTSGLFSVYLTYTPTKLDQTPGNCGFYLQTNGGICTTERTN
jgi:hypothetical protein